VTGAAHVEQVQLLADHYRPFGWSDRSVDGYLVAIGDLDVEVVRRAVVDTIRTHDKMPSGAELRRSALRLVTGDGPPDVDVAWTEVLTRFGTHGRLRTPTWSHPLIGEAIAAIGGWGRLCGTEDQTGTRIAFTRAYRALVDRAEQTALTSPGLAAAAALVAGSAALPAPPTLRLVTNTEGKT
jgi:hypothetical protein